MQLLHLVSKEEDADGHISLCLIDIHTLALNPEGASLKVYLLSGVHCLHKPVEQFGAAEQISALYLYGVGVEIFRVAHSVEAGDTGDYNYIPSAAQKRVGAVEAEFVYLVIYAKVLLYVGICVGKVSLRLIVVVVGDKVLHCVVGEEGLELSVELRCKSLVMTEHKSRPLQVLYYIGHCEGLARACHTQQGYCICAALYGLCYLLYCLRLVSGRLESGGEFKIHSR